MTNYRFTASHVSKATLLADSASIIENWTPRTLGASWKPETGGVPSPYVIRVTGLNGFAYGQGLAVPTAWRWVLTSEMYNYLYATKFSGAQSVNATIQDYDVMTATWRVWQVVATLNEQNAETLEPFANTWLRSVTVTFAQGEEQT